MEWQRCHYPNPHRGRHVRRQQYWMRGSQRGILLVDRGRNKDVEGPAQSAGVEDADGNSSQGIRLEISPARSCRRATGSYQCRGLKVPTISRWTADEVRGNLAFLWLCFQKSSSMYSITKGAAAISGSSGLHFRPMYLNSHLSLHPFFPFSLPRYC